MSRITLVILFLLASSAIGKVKNVSALSLHFTNHGGGKAHVTWALPQNLLTSPTSINFGNIVIGQQSASLTIVLSTTSGVVFTNIVLSGANDFSFTSACPAVLNINQNCSLAVKFAPKALGPQSANLTVSFAGLIPNAPSTLHVIVSEITVSKNGIYDAS